VEERIEAAVQEAREEAECKATALMKLEIDVSNEKVNRVYDELEAKEKDWEAKFKAAEAKKVNLDEAAVKVAAC